MSTALVPLAGTAAAATIEVANYVALTAAVAPGCQDGTVLRATGDMAEGNLTVLTVSCDVTLDINGHYLQIGPVVIGTG
ncbi:hypothetical protein [Nocardioides sp.]|uniref:hypothetical protein n=1 Tax=Nocardioides sp. TaxID=35761 RepID=UPI0035176D5E